MSALLGLDETTLVASKEIAIDRKFATKPAGKKVVKLTDTVQLSQVAQHAKRAKERDDKKQQEARTKLNAEAASWSLHQCTLVLALETVFSQETCAAALQGQV
jgi:hypothetical protein